MEEFDSQKAARVWQRVKQRESTTGQSREKPWPLLHQSQALAGLYLGLRRQMPGQQGIIVRELYRQHRELVACLKGMCLADGITVPGLGAMTAGTGTTRNILTGCFHRELRLGEGLSRMVSEEAFGPACRILAEQADRRCLEVLKLLGDWKED